MKIVAVNADACAVLGLGELTFINDESVRRCIRKTDIGGEDADIAARPGQKRRFRPCQDAVQRQDTGDQAIEEPFQPVVVALALAG